MPLGSVMGFARDARRRLWAITPVAVVWLDAATDTWTSARDMGIDPGWPPERLYADRQGGIWVAVRLPRWQGFRR